MAGTSGCAHFQRSAYFKSSRYEMDTSLLQVSFSEAERSLNTIIALLGNQGIFPLKYPVD